MTSLRIETFNFAVKSQKREEFILITEEIETMIVKSNIKTGTVKVFLPHTTAGLTINQHANPDVARDIITIADANVPRKKLLNVEGISDAHYKSVIFGTFLDIPIERGKMILGEWQGVFLCEFDGPRTRRINVQIWGID